MYTTDPSMTKNTYSANQKHLSNLDPLEISRTFVFEICIPDAYAYTFQLTHVYIYIYIHIYSTCPHIHALFDSGEVQPDPGFSAIQFFR